MPKSYRNILLSIILFYSCTASPTKLVAEEDTYKIINTSPENTFTHVRTPSEGEPEVFGTYSAGCIAGANALARSGKGYELMRPSRHRFFAHPETIALIKRAGREATHGAPLLIGDLSMPRGGPTVGGHASHQIGLDMDIWFYYPKGLKFSKRLRETLQARSVVEPDGFEINHKLWRKVYDDYLLWFSEQPNVDRIFVNAAIKKHLCEKYGGDPRLAKIRPWYGHDSHFHVRLNCPEDQKFCKAQEPVDSIGCDQSLAWWFSEEASKEAAKPAPAFREVALPMACKNVADDNYQ